MKAFDQVWKSITGIPAGDLSAKRYTFVAFDANSNIITPATAGAAAVGVLYEPNTVGQPAQVVAQGLAFIVLGAALAAGAPVMTDIAGKAIAHVGVASPAENYKLGTLMVGGAIGDIGTVLLG